MTTIEGVGNKADGFNDIQNRIVDYNASQCGWCTPGIWNFQKLSLLLIFLWSGSEFYFLKFIFSFKLAFK